MLEKFLNQIQSFIKNNTKDSQKEIIDEIKKSEAILRLEILSLKEDLKND